MAIIWWSGAPDYIAHVTLYLASDGGITAGQPVSIMQLELELLAAALGGYAAALAAISRVRSITQHRKNDMKAYYFDRLGIGVDGLALGERPEPKPGRNEVLVRVHARSLNYRDLLILTGRYAFSGKTGKIALSDGAGEVVALGEDVTRVAIGDRVACGYFPRWVDGPISIELAADQFGCTRDGMLAPLVVADEQAVVKVPAHLSFAEVATLPCAAVTAWSSLTGPRPILPGDTVLTIGTGGVALFALQLAKLFGARIIAITSTDAKAARLKELGADDVVNYRSNPDWDVQIRKLTTGNGVEHVVETGGLDTLPKSIACAGDESVINVVAALGQGTVDSSVFRSRVLIRRIYVGGRRQFESMNRAIALHKLRPVIDRVFSFSEAKQAYQRFEAREHIGKVVIATEHFADHVVGADGAGDPDTA